MKILITGGSGFIGTNLLEMFASRGENVVNLDISRPKNPLHLKYWIFVDILDAEALSSSIRSFGPDIIFHLAARTDLDGGSIEDYSVNTIGVKNIISAIENLPSLKRIIFASSRLVCRIGYSPKSDLDYCPTTPYGESKVVGEEIVRSSMVRLSCVSLIVRPTSIWGPWFDVPYKNFFLAIYKGRYFHPGTRKILKSYGFVGNTVYQLDRLMHASDESVSGKTMYLADYPPIELSEMATAIQKQLAAPEIKNYGIRFMWAIALIGDILKHLGWKSPPLSSFRLKNLLTTMVYDLEPLSKIVGPLPYSMNEGVARTIGWMRNNKQIT